MRLTLRTLLAYLDREHLKNLLSREESQALEELGSKIGSNEFASGLVERIQSSLGRPRLGAPKLDGRGIGLDPNTVAEFLDNSLHQDRMQEFEKVCLESDVHLAEVAACHQILSLVLAERPDVPQELREKMYELPHRTPLEPIAAPAVTPTSEESRPSTATKGRIPRDTSRAPNQGPKRDVADKRPSIDMRSQIPDYLRASRRNSSWKPLLAMVALVLLLLTVGLLAMGSLDSSHPVLGPLLAARSPSAEPPLGGRADPTSDTGSGEVTRQARSRPTVPPTPESSSTVIEPAEDRREEPASVSGTEGRANHTQNGEPSRSTEEPFEDELTEGPDVNTSPDPNIQLDLDKLTEDAPLLPTELERSGMRPPSTPATGPDDRIDPFADLARALTTPSEPTSDKPLPVPPPVEEMKEDEAEPVGREVGRFIAAERDHILARWDTERLAWLRLRARSVLSSGEKLLVLPSYRPQIALSSGIHMMLVGPAFVELGPPDASGTSSLRLQEGRALLDTAGIAGSQLDLRFPGSSGTLVFESSDSAVAVEVRPLTQWGQDPGLAEPTMGCEIHATTGDLTWRDREGNTAPLRSGQVLWLTGTAPAVVHDTASPPNWIEARDQREIDLRASRGLAQLVDTNRPISLALFEQVGHRQIEVSALATEALTMVDEFEPVLSALRNERHHAYWRSYVAALESAIRRGPSTAATVRAALAKHRLEEAPIFYRLLYGFSEQQLASDGAQELVTLLESPSMEVRILAFENLRRITNRTHLYRPEREPIQQRKALQDWRNTLNRGEITYQSAD